MADQVEQTDGADSARDRFDDLCFEFTGADSVTVPSVGRGFGRMALRYQGKIFAMFVRGSLVLKLPSERVRELVASGDGAHFDANKGVPMKEWLNLSPESEQEWLPLAEEALAFAQAFAQANPRPAKKSGSRTK